MYDSYAIGSVTSQIKSVCERIQNASCSISDEKKRNSGKVYSLIEEQMISQLKDLQQLTLCLTELFFPNRDVDSNMDEGSVFAEGELTDNIGDKTDGKGEDIKSPLEKTPEGGDA